MNILVISDTHGQLDYAHNVMMRLTNGNSIGLVIHLGDMIGDAVRLARCYETVPFHYVAGNCDSYKPIAIDETVDETKTIHVNQVRILLAHGHQYGVKAGFDRIAEAARVKGAAVALCGHTHQTATQQIGNVTVMNPGSISYPKGMDAYPTYGILEITDNKDVIPRLCQIVGKDRFKPV